MPSTPVSGDRVAALSSVDGHTIWANSLALQRAGITRDTPDPVGGEIVRDASGEPTGILRESAQELLDVIPHEESPLRPWLERCQDWLLSVGLTSITDIDGEDARAAYAELHADGALRLRVTKCTRDPDLELAIAEGRRSGQGDDVFRVGPVKFFSDGALGSHTAHMTEPFIGHEGCGIAAMPYDVLLERTLLAARSGLDVVTHAIGDEAQPSRPRRLRGGPRRGTRQRCSASSTRSTCGPSTSPASGRSTSSPRCSRATARPTSSSPTRSSARAGSRRMPGAASSTPACAWRSARTHRSRTRTRSSACTPP